MFIAVAHVRFPTQSFQSRTTVRPYLSNLTHPLRLLFSPEYVAVSSISCPQSILTIFASKARRANMIRSKETSFSMPFLTMRSNFHPVGETLPAELMVTLGTRMRHKVSLHCSHVHGVGKHRIFIPSAHIITRQSPLTSLSC